MFLKIDGMDLRLKMKRQILKALVKAYSVL